MAALPTYWLDANVLISAKDGPFRFAVVPAFWSALDAQALTGRLRIPHMVYEEIVKNEDELGKWLKNRRNNGFRVKPSKTVQGAYTQVADYVAANYDSHQAGVFLSVADPWVIAHAMEGKGTVVTFETFQATAKKVKIPNVCQSLGVPYVNLYDMLQRLKIKFT